MGDRRGAYSIHAPWNLGAAPMESASIRLRANGRDLTVPAGLTLLEALARRDGVLR